MGREPLGLGRGVERDRGKQVTAIGHKGGRGDEDGIQAADQTDGSNRRLSACDGRHEMTEGPQADGSYVVVIRDGESVEQIAHRHASVFTVSADGSMTANPGTYSRIIVTREIPGQTITHCTGIGTSNGEGSITIDAAHREDFRRWTQQLQAQYNPPVKPRSKRGQRKRTWGHG